MNAPFPRPPRLNAPLQRTEAPEHGARVLTHGGTEASILLGDTAYVLRITRLGKLILTK